MYWLETRDTGQHPNAIAMGSGPAQPVFTGRVANLRLFETRSQADDFGVACLGRGGYAVLGADDIIWCTVLSSDIAGPVVIFSRRDDGDHSVKTCIPLPYCTSFTDTELMRAALDWIGDDRDEARDLDRETWQKEARGLAETLRTAEYKLTSHGLYGYNIAKACALCADEIECQLEQAQDDRMAAMAAGKD